MSWRSPNPRGSVRQPVQTFSWSGVCGRHFKWKIWHDTLPCFNSRSFKTTLRQKFRIHIFHMDELDSVCPVWFFLTGAVPASRRVSGSVFSHGFPAVRLPAGVVLPQRSPLELGRSDHAVGPADPPAEGWIWNLQSGTHPVFTCSPVHFNLQRLGFDVWCFILRPKQETLWKWLKCCSKLFFFLYSFYFKYYYLTLWQIENWTFRHFYPHLWLCVLIYFQN